MDKRSRRRFTKDFKAETVALIRHSGKSIAEVCRDMGLAEGSVHPPILHRKEIFVGADYPRRETFARLTTQEERLGLVS